MMSAVKGEGVKGSKKIADIISGSSKKWCKPRATVQSEICVESVEWVLRPSCPRDADGLFTDGATQLKAEAIKGVLRERKICY